MENLTGKQLGPYRIIERLGAGGMATVFKAYQPRMDRFVALKILPRHLSDNPEFVLRFKQEAQVIAKLEHPHILPVFDFGESDGYTYLAMRLLEGGTLADLMKKKGRLDLPTANRIMRQVGEALDYAHKEGVIHRDFKPGNVLLDKFGNCLLTDFGIAKLLEATTNLTATGGILGTPTYVSPEQGMGKTIDIRSDIYSVGVVVYQMVTGEVPYKADTPMGVIFKHVQDPLPMPRNKVPDLPEAVELVILKAMAKNPEDRFQSVTDMVAALEAAVTQPTIPSLAVQEPKPPEVREDPTEKILFEQTATADQNDYQTPLREKTGFPRIAAIILMLAMLGAGGVYGYFHFWGYKPILTVKTSPSGADVYIDNAHAGRSPAFIRELPPGAHKITVKKEKYIDFEDTVLIQSGEPRIANAELQPLPIGDVNISSNPSGAEVFIDGKRHGTTPLQQKDLPKGKRKVVLSKEGFDKWEGSVEIVPLHEESLSVDLISIYGGLQISSAPEGADIFIDGKSAGSSPLALDELTPGSHEVSIRKNRYETFQVEVYIRKGKTETLRAELIPLPFGDLQISSHPPGASVFLDGKERGVTPLSLRDVPKGTHTVKLRLNNFYPWEEDVEIIPLTEAKLTADLVAAYARLSIITAPEDAEVLIDGRPAGRTPLTLDKVKKGIRRVELRKNGFDPWRGKVEVQIETANQLKVDMATIYGDLVIKSAPSGATILLDGKKMGTTPSVLSKLERGKHEIELVKEGHEPWQDAIEIQAGQSQEITAPLSTIYGQLEIASNPSGAEVRIDGETVGRTPIRLSDIEKGNHALSFRMEGYDLLEKEVLVVPSELKVLSVKLKESYGSLKVSSRPDAAEIRIHGKSYGKTPLVIEKMAKGKIEIEARLACHQGAFQTVNVTAGDEIALFFELEKICGTLAIQSDPTEAAWYLDGKAMGKTPAKLTGVQEGRHQIRLVKNGYKEWEQEIIIKPGKSEALSLELERLRFTRNEDGVVSDHQSGLQWFANKAGWLIWFEAKDWAESLSVAGKGWRLPTIEELKTLYDKGKGKRNMTELLNQSEWWIWSSEAKDKTTAWGFDFSRGKKSYERFNYPDGAGVLAVRSPEDIHKQMKIAAAEKEKQRHSNLPSSKKEVAPPAVEQTIKDRDDRFIAYESGIILDTKTGLEWYTEQGKRRTWNGANNWTSKLDMDGQGWRMPTLDELRNMTQIELGENNIIPLLGVTGNVIWAELEENSSVSWYFDLKNRRELRDYKHSRKMAFAVRYKEKTTIEQTPEFTLQSVRGGNRFRHYPSGVILDIETGLEWYISPSALTLEKAKRWIETLVVDISDASDQSWRLPTEKEIKRFRDARKDLLELSKTSWIWLGEKKAWLGKVALQFDWKTGVSKTTTDPYAKKYAFAVRSGKR